MNVKIKDIPASERPRERLINKGVDFLNNEELIAIILKTGTRELSVKQLANLILKELDKFSDLKEIKLESLTKIKGIGDAKASSLLAAIELGKRLNKKIEDINKIQIVDADTVYLYYKDILADKKQEHFYTIYLDTKNNIIKDKLLYVGTVNQSLIHPREIFKEAYLLSATSIICLHNHPSGSFLPSKEDIKITEILLSTSKILGIKLLDHIIIGNGYYSFLEHGLIS